MTPFQRQPAPPFWAEKEAQWASRAEDWAKLDPLRWQYDSRTLHGWFHQLCRGDDEPRRCAYCDGALEETARETIDHLAPKARFPALAVTWHNLFPACDLCNSTYKRDQWSCAIVRPDTDPVDEWFDIDMTTGRLRPSATIDDRTIRARVRLTIGVFRLNTIARCKARRNVVRDMSNALKRHPETGEHDHLTVEELIAYGPYRFVARRFRQALDGLSHNPSSRPGPPEPR